MKTKTYKCIDCGWSGKAEDAKIHYIKTDEIICPDCLWELGEVTNEKRN